jgi:tRNA-2-methylthio-N6-dimethylallyladenosine synthase
MATLSKKSFFIKTFGCQMNHADSEQMASIMAEGGAVPAADVEDADIVILNGCEVRDHAVHKMLSHLGRLKSDRKSSKRLGPKAKEGQIIGIGGCVGSLRGDQLFSRNPHVDFVFGTDTIAQLPELIHRVSAGEKHVVFNAFDKKDDYDIETKVFTKSASAFVNIMKGCDKFCSYCIVPFTRGREKSRPLEDIVSDVERLVLHGVKEITLLGQNVNSYGQGYGVTFPQLLRAVDAIKGLKRLRYTSSHPIDFSDELINCYGELETLAPHLHLPVQSGSNPVLQKMHRHYKIETYYEQIEKWRARCPQGGLSTDIIVGFPTETDADFELTMQLMEDMKYDMVYAFAYSPRPGTKAAKLEDNVPDDEKNRRLVHLQRRVVEIAREGNQRFVGQVAEVLVEGPVKAIKNAPSQSMWQGRTGSNHVVNFPYEGPRDFTGQFIPLRITAATGLALQGEIPVSH